MAVKKEVTVGGAVCKCLHHKVFRWAVLVVGLLYLLQDLNVITWWGWLNWWTAAFLLVGLGVFCKCCNSKFL